MKKEFDNWNKQKIGLHTEGKRKFYHAREVWWCALGVNVGSEQDGTSESYRRPVLILKGFGPDICLVIPLTTSLHTHHLRIPVGLVDDKEAVAILSQIKVVDTKRLVRKIGYIEKKNFEIIRKIARDML